MASTTIKATAVSTAIAIALGTAPPVLAQELEEVVVTGYRGSLEAALDFKRESSGIVDAISATDIGKFPDTNLAESLQRITGVSVNRVEGEGSEVTIRGFGGQFNLVTLNGRQLPAADNAVNFFGLNANQAAAIRAPSTFRTLRLRAYRACRSTNPAGLQPRPAVLVARSMFKPIDPWTSVLSSPFEPKPLTTPVATALRRSLAVWAAGQMTTVRSA